jgi:RNA polymerase sigma factor (sigma-70 family)
LIAAYAESGDAIAFAELLERHQRMVFRTRLRILDNTHEAQDAAKATFIVLMNKAGRLKREGALGGWLHTVARQISLAALERRAAEPRRREAAAEAMTDSGDTDSVVKRERIMRHLDAEIERLSALQRQTVVLRYLDGLSERDAADLVGCPVGTLSQRASDGTAKLRARLSKRGIAVGATALAAALESEAHAAMPEALLSSTIAAACLVVAAGGMVTAQQMSQPGKATPATEAGHPALPAAAAQAGAADAKDESAAAPGVSITAAHLTNWIAFARSGEFVRTAGLEILEEAPAPRPGTWAKNNGRIGELPIEFNSDKTIDTRHYRSDGLLWS